MNLTKMQYKKMCYIDKNREVVPFVPEIETKLVEVPMKIKKKIFPYKRGLDYRKLIMTNIGIYSRMSRRVAEEEIKIIKRRFKEPQKLVITEANGGVGGLSVYLVQHFKSVKNSRFKQDSQRCHRK